MIEKISVENSLENYYKGALFIDVRSQAEFHHAHIPNAVNIPLLNNEQRVIVGTTYKNIGKEAAIRKGFELCGAEFSEKIKQLDELENKAETIIVYCWRGGLRSEIMCWLFTMAGYKVFQLEKGYKNFRNLLLESFQLNYKFLILGGFTGSKKTHYLHKLSLKGLPVIDLEKIANHRGSAFGALGMGEQPTQEMFENHLALELLKYREKQIFVENESRMIGKKYIPTEIYKQLEKSNYLFLETSLEERIQNIKQDYLKYDIDSLKECTLKLNKKLGGYDCKYAITHLENGEYDNWIEILLKYYDKNYKNAYQKKNYNSVFSINTLSKTEEEVLFEIENIYNSSLAKKTSIHE